MVKELSRVLLTFTPHVPCEFNRKQRSMEDVDRWKATEFRQFLLYTGPVSLKGLVPTQVYNNFMLLSVGITILLNVSLCADLADYAHGILVLFVDHCSKLYGKEHVTYNMHGLVHLWQDAKKYGVLDNISCFPFENFLGRLKKLLRKPTQPLEQVVRRLSERSQHRRTNISKTRPLREHNHGPLLNGLSVKKQYEEYYFQDFVVKRSEGNNCVLLENKDIVVIENVVVDEMDNTLVIYKSTWEKHHFKFMKGAGKRKRSLTSKYRPQASSDEEESCLPDAPAVLSFQQPLLSFENLVPSNKVSVLPDAPEVASIPENQENVEPSVDFRADFQRLQNENQALRDENQALRDENQALRDENQALRESNAPAASDDSGSLQEQVKQVGTMLKTFARTGQSGADQTLILRRLGEFGDVVRSMDIKMDTMLQHFSAGVSVGGLSLPGDLLLPLDTQDDLALLDSSLRQDKELQQRFLRFLAIKCGRDLKTTVWRMLESIFSNRLSINTTWTGAGEKACFRDMFLKTIVQRAIRKNSATQDATDEAIQVNVTRYLKGAADREGGKRRRTAERDPQPTPQT
ncbi:uncharacterized protein LOC127619500 [Xyrauchen texanus]|uniref:uncharacterized protein LOC127619500 n=1 Tax=Xyrauchen texanus TaxID=154827 RepID=UPI0022426DEA|nr:uncharacterized protein LOC127619500 [Xyrauchen texanus]